MKKYIFPVGVLLFVVALVMGITHFTQPAKPEPKIMAGWKHISFDQTGNSYYIDPNSISKDSQTEDELRFHATFYKIYSEKGLKELIQSYNIDASKMSEFDHEIDEMYFRDFDGIKYITGAKCKFYKTDGTEISELAMAVSFDENINTRPIPGKSIGENLFDYAYQRVEKD